MNSIISILLLLLSNANVAGFDVLEDWLLISFVNNDGEFTYVYQIENHPEWGFLWNQGELFDACEFYEDVPCDLNGSATEVASTLAWIELMTFFFGNGHYVWDVVIIYEGLLFEDGSFLIKGCLPFALCGNAEETLDPAPAEMGTPG